MKIPKEEEEEEGVSEKNRQESFFSIHSARFFCFFFGLFCYVFFFSRKTTSSNNDKHSSIVKTIGNFLIQVSIGNKFLISVCRKKNILDIPYWMAVAAAFVTVYRTDFPILPPLQKIQSNLMMIMTIINGSILDHHHRKKIN